MNKSQAFSNQTSGNHGIAYCGLYTGNGTGDSFMTDISTLSALENTGNPTSAAGITVFDTSKFLLQSGVLDVTVRNTSGLNTDSVVVADSAAKLEVDVYEVLSGKEWRDSSATYPNVYEVLLRGSTMTLNGAGAGTGITPLQRGVTPWDIPAALSYFKLKILKKTKYFVNNGDTFTYQIRDPKRRVMMQDKMEKIEGGNQPGWTRHLFFIFKLVPGLTIGTANGTYTESITLGITRKYLYKIEGANDDRDRYLANT